MTINKTTKWIILLTAGILYAALIILFRFLNFFSELTFIFLLSIAPIILINVFFILEKNITSKFKNILPIFSSVFIIAYCYIFLFLIPTKFVVIEKFKDHEFGILLYSNIEKESKAIVDLKRVKKKLEEIKILPSNLNKAIRIEKIDDSKNTSSELEFNDFIQREIINLNASVAIVIHRFISDSIYSEININEKLIKPGIQRLAFKIISSPFRLADVLKDNVESLLKLTMIDSIEVEIVEPKTNIERAITSNRHYEKSTIILERIFEIPNESPERKKRIEQAESELKKSIQLDSLNDKSLAMLAYIKNTEESKHDSAAIYYERARRVQPHNFSYTWNLAQTYYLTGETEKAILTLEEYLKRYGNSIEDASQKMEMEKLLRSFQEFK